MRELYSGSTEHKSTNVIWIKDGVPLYYVNGKWAKFYNAPKLETASPSQDGLMSKEDKEKFDFLTRQVTDSDMERGVVGVDTVGMTKSDYGYHFMLPLANDSYPGLMSNVDKVKLKNLPNVESAIIKDRIMFAIIAQPNVPFEVSILHTTKSSEGKYATVFGKFHCLVVATDGGFIRIVSKIFSTENLTNAEYPLYITYFDYQDYPVSGTVPDIQFQLSTSNDDTAYVQVIGGFGGGGHIVSNNPPNIATASYKGMVHIGKTR